MINALQSELTINVVASIIVSLLFLGLGFLWGKYKERKRKFGRNLEEIRFLSVYCYSGKLRRVQPERFPVGNALLPQERRSHSRETAHLHR